jgi:hypothetical protein
MCRLFGTIIEQRCRVGAANWRAVLLAGFESTKVATPDNRNDNEQVKKAQQQQNNKTRGKV